jgi:hypothetical protein
MSGRYLEDFAVGQTFGSCRLRVSKVDDARSETRKATRSATSSGSARRETTRP